MCGVLCCSSLFMGMETKKCNNCKNEKPISEFRTLEKKWLTNQCIECLRKNGRDRYWKHHKKYKATARKYAKTRNPNKRYFMSVKYRLNIPNPREWYETQLIKQNGGCAICGNKSNLNRSHFCADHDHTTNKVRGLLCSWCNRMIGYAQDNPTLLESASNYLKEYQK